ncbi:Peptidoglycan glycosyltransferase FtsW [Poriferisphaera corsica]|uniref:Probable peptidoglycan glycosyltransferase FtsW n=2 Tax=Poriferisphaera corsica TaxID=2528020 RepID=A0A517YR12_9BACT|nr:Peptidoglycan glycosyltransferase FtsW [Poriferisphaera corsica]
MLTAAALLCFGLLMVQSAGMYVGATDIQTTADVTTSWTNYLSKFLTSSTALHAALAILAMLFASRINVRQFFTSRGLTNPLPYLILIAFALVILTQVPGIGREVNASKRWLAIGTFTFQPSEIVKWVMILAIAYWCARKRGIMHRFLPGLFPPIILIAIACGLIVIEDLGTAALIGLVSFCLLYAGGARIYQLILLAVPALAAVYYFITSSSYRMDRITAFLDPWADPQGTGFHPIQSMTAIAEGGLFGKGLGNGVRKLGYLPEDTTDFIYAIICEELGIFGAIAIIVLFTVLLFTGLGIIRETRDTFGRLVALGFILTITIQALINVAVVTVVIPTKGIALPLVSKGGTGWILTAFAIGLVASLDNAHHLEASPIDSPLESPQLSTA